MGSGQASTRRMLNEACQSVIDAGFPEAVPRPGGILIGALGRIFGICNESSLSEDHALWYIDRAIKHGRSEFDSSDLTFELNGYRQIGIY
jgi:hypothetical protein